MKIHQISYAIFETISHFSQRACIILATTLHTFDKNIPSDCKFFRFSTALVKIHQISPVIFETKSEFFFKVWITLHCHERQLLCIFFLKPLYFGQKEPFEVKFSDFCVVG